MSVEKRAGGQTSAVYLPVAGGTSASLCQLGERERGVGEMDTC